MTTIHDLIDEVINENLRPVTQLIHRYHLEGRLPCTCRDCLLDIAALTLNHIRPRYSVSLLKELHLSQEDQRRYDEELRQALDVACARVRVHPHHA